MYFLQIQSEVLHLKGKSSGNIFCHSRLILINLKLIVALRCMKAIQSIPGNLRRFQEKTHDQRSQKEGKEISRQQNQ